jgi:serine/threonine protein kinase
MAPAFWNHTVSAIIVAGIALGMNYLHNAGVIHAMLKPADILLDERHRPKITDYATFTMEQIGAVKPSQVGSPGYIAPELYEDSVLPSTSVDVFSFGLILYELVVGTPAFSPSLSASAVMKRVVLGQRPDIPASVSPIVRRLITQCWSGQPSDRPRFAEILSQLTSCDFKIFPDVDSETITKFIEEMQYSGPP